MKLGDGCFARRTQKELDGDRNRVHMILCYCIHLWNPKGQGKMCD